MRNKWLVRIVLFCSMIALMLVMTTVRTQNAGDRLNKHLTVSRGRTVTCTVDLAKEGSVKKLLNPNIYTLYLRLETEALPLRCEGKSNEMELFLSQGTKKGIWTELQTDEKLAKRRGVIPLNVELKVPREALERYAVAQGELVLYSEQGEYGKIILKVLNSEKK
ncbi:MAG: hypothetical protein SO119_02910 [Phascolarctobacterium sp.]|nr:hypothetical protein [Phascolarctobacterium sp.]